MVVGKNYEDVVAPLAGAWIEIIYTGRKIYQRDVAPLAGAWIEMNTHRQKQMWICVAPLAGAWIEIYLSNIILLIGGGRSPCGSVD